jgi:hypothetical protein
MPIYKTDYILRLLAFSLEIGIRFVNPQLHNTTTRHHTPIYTLFKDNPSLYNSSVRLLRKNNIFYLSDCISNDGRIILPFKDIIHLHSTNKPSGVIPRWYHHIKSITSISPNSIQIKEQFRTAQLALNRPLLTISEDMRQPLERIMIPDRKYKTSYWCATWNDADSCPIFGRLVKNAPNDVVIQHWTINPNDLPSNNFLTPKSRPIRLQECPGCSLHDPSINRQIGNKPIDQSLVPLPCLSTNTHNNVVSLKHLQQSKFRRIPNHVSLELRSTLYQLTSQIRSTLCDANPLRHRQDTTPQIIIPTDPVNPLPTDLSTGLFYQYNTTYSPINLPNTRTAMKLILSAYNFSSLLLLGRWNNILMFHQNKTIDWQATWSTFNHHTGAPKNSTSFAHSSRISFSTKLMLDELPLLAHLQTRRRPDLYQADWNCILCHTDKETWSHLWSCPSLIPLFKTLLHDTKLSFEQRIIPKATRHSSLHFQASWHDLDCWKYPTPDTKGLLTFDYLLRGFIPRDLTQEISKFCNSKVSYKILGDSLNSSINQFREQIWLPRCKDFARFEAHMNIEQAAKTSAPKPALRKLTTTINRTTEHTHSHPTNSWKSWIVKSLDANSLRNWMDFHIHINNLFYSNS